MGLGRATRLLEYLVGHDKEYRARIRLGERRDTLDREGRLLETLPVPSLSPRLIEEALGQFRGAIVQIPPAYSAIKVQGVPLHRRARRGEEVEPPPRTVEIRELELEGIEAPDVLLRISCSSGTYVRSLARDLGAALGTAAALWELTRTRSGPFGLGDARSLAEVVAAGPEAWPWVLPAERMVDGLPACTISAEDAREIAQGRALRRVPDEEGGPIALFGPDGNLVAVARPQGGCLQPVKVFDDAG